MSVCWEEEQKLGMGGVSESHLPDYGDLPGKGTQPEAYVQCFQDIMHETCTRSFVLGDS